MGLFNFAKNIGKRIFKKEDDEQTQGAALQGHITEDNPGIEDLTVEVQGDTAVLKGKAASAEALEKAVLMAGNAMGIENVEAAEVEAPEQTATVEYYEIQSGDSLWKIADKVYGNGSEYTKLFEANREVIKDPDLIFPGQIIRVPKD